MTSHWDPNSASRQVGPPPAPPPSAWDPETGTYRLVDPGTGSFYAAASPAVPVPPPVETYSDPRTYAPSPATNGWPQHVPNGNTPAAQPQPPPAWLPQGVGGPMPQPGTQQVPQGPVPAQPATWPTQGPAPAQPGAWPSQVAPPQPGAWSPHPAPPPQPGTWVPQPDNQPVDARPPWDHSTFAPSAAVETDAQHETAEQWVPVDPRSYSDPGAQSPVYTSGPQPLPISTPVLVHANGTSVRPGATPPAPDADLLYGFGQPQPLPITANGADAVPPGSQNGAPPGVEHDPAKGELKIKERRSWRTWQLLSAVLVAAVLGMWINGSTGGSATDASGGPSAGGTLPPPSGTTATTGAGSGTNAGSGSATSTTAAGSTSTTAAGSSTGTTVAGGSSGSTATSAPATVGPATVLVPEVQQTGNWTSSAFTIAGGTWNIGWAFQCVPAPTATPSFQIFVVKNGGAPGSTPAVTSSVASGNAITPLTSTGAQQVIVQTTAACRWAVKVTGSSS